MKRWILIAVMAPVMWGLFRLVLWADRLHAWRYFQNYPPPTAADFTRAAVVFWASVLTPIVVGFVVAIVAFRRKYQPVWPILETGIIAVPYLSYIAGASLGILYGERRTAYIFWFVILRACVLVGGAVVATCLNLGACLRRGAWGRFALSAAAVCAGMFYLLWLSGFIIYIDT